MDTDGGGWTVFQRRKDGSVDFNRGWDEYKAGFGELTGEFWFGNDKIHRLTAARSNSLRVDMTTAQGVQKFAKYGEFSIGNEATQYKVHAPFFSYSGKAGHGFLSTSNWGFSTKDRYNGLYASYNCAAKKKSGWWFRQCGYSNLNGVYVANLQSFDTKAIAWVNDVGLVYTDIKVKPTT